MLLGLSIFKEKPDHRDVGRRPLTVDDRCLFGALLLDGIMKQF